MGLVKMARKSGVMSRIQLAAGLLHELDEVYKKSEELMSRITNDSDKYLIDAYDEGAPEIKSKTGEYKQNVLRMKTLGNDVTRDINGWYEFSQDRTQMKSLVYPLKFSIRLNSLKRRIKKANDEMQRLTIRNRFLKEELIVWEQELERKTLKDMENSEEYIECKQCRKCMNDIIADLKFILPSIPGICPVSVEVGKAGLLAERLPSIP